MNHAICTVLLSALYAAGAQGAKLDIDPERITVSGISAGGAMAHQLHIAYPEVFSGAAIIAGPPYGCAAGDLDTALARCLGHVTGEFPLDELLEGIRTAAAEGRIGSPELLADDRVWLFHGARDTVVAAAVSDALSSLYAELIEPENLVRIDDFQAAHLFPTIDQGGDCLVSEAPFIGACGFDAAGELLRHIYPETREQLDSTMSSPIEVELPGAEAAVLADSAWLYLPEACARGTRSCALHLVLHGCGQSAAQVGTTFIEQSGYLRWAEASAVVLAFPQVKPSAGNPLSCWDWWGYTGPEYRWRDGAQMRVLAEWVQQLAGPPKTEECP